MKNRIRITRIREYQMKIRRRIRRKVMEDKVKSWRRMG